MFKNKKGSGFAELIIAVTILNVILLSLIPSFIHVTKSTLRNNIRTNAYNLGIRQLERVKSLDYDDAGLKNGNPGGLIDYNKTEVRNGLNYTVKTKMTWVDDEADGLYPVDKDPRDYKRVEVIIGTPSIVKLPAQVFTTDITRQSQEQIASGGNIEVEVVDSENNPIEDALAKVDSGPTSPVESYTGANGKTTFIMLAESVTEGDYSLSVEKKGYVVEPTMRNQTTSVRSGELRILQFLISIPGKLNVSLIDDDSGALITSNSKVTLNFSSAQPLEYSSNDGSFSIADLYPGTYELGAQNGEYELSNSETVVIEEGKTNNITLRMKKKKQGNLHLTVVDSDTGIPVTYADVYITSQDGEFSTQDITNTQGVLDKQLVQQTYKLQISKQDYTTSLTDFTISNTGDTDVNITLKKNAPSGATIRVLVRRRRNSKPVANVYIFVMGPQYQKLIKTDSQGEALFTDLKYGWYAVYRWRWGWRTIAKPLMKDGEEKTYTVRY